MSKLDNKKTSFIDDLQMRLSHTLNSFELLRAPEGMTTGISIFDDFLLWKGLPKGDLTLLYGNPDAGAIRLWANTASQLQKCDKGIAWVNFDLGPLPEPLLQKRLNLNQLFIIKTPEKWSNAFLILQELITSDKFEMIGCRLPSSFLKNQQLHDLKKLAAGHNVTLVLISHSKVDTANPVFSLVIDCQKDFYTVKRALHRPTPFAVPWSMIQLELGI